jgi:hypothetical protein
VVQQQSETTFCSSAWLIICHEEGEVKLRKKAGGMPSHSACFVIGNRCIVFFFASYYFMVS